MMHLESLENDFNNQMKTFLKVWYFLNKEDKSSTKVAERQ